MTDFVLAVHGGAGGLVRERLDPAFERTARDALAACLREGLALLAHGASAVDAVERAVSVLEDCEVFNAGRGSVLTSEGTVEMDAAIMDGASRKAGAVACVRRLVNPVAVARLVMERSPHVLLVGEGAENLAREYGARIAEPESFIVADRIGQLERARARAVISLDSDQQQAGTVGAVARDARGHLASATSTGGMTNQLPGRVGDSPLIGAGTWARDDTCAVSGTGQGEAYVRLGFAHELDALMRHAGLTLAVACDRVLAALSELGARGGCVAVDRNGEVVMPFTTTAMYRGRIGGDAQPYVAIFPDETQ